MNQKKLKKDVIRLSKELSKLLNEWDPIGVLPFQGGPQDEYDCFHFPIISLLEQGENKSMVVNFLNNYLKKHVGLVPDQNNLKRFVNKVMKWWEE